VRVGLLDTRLAPHPQLTARYIGRLNDLLPTGQHEPTEFDGHCTFIASCILQQAPAAELRLRHVLDSQGEGTAWEAAVAVAELVPLRLDVVNLSLGEYMTDDDSTPMVLERAVEQLGDDTVVVAAAGNNGDVVNHPLANMPKGVTPSTVSYPAALTKVVAVGALDAYNDRAPFTPKEPDDLRWIELLARGADVNAAYLYGTVQLPGGRTEKFEGTANWAGCSFAAGVVTGVIAARTVPGRRSARQALNQLENSLRQQGQPGLLIN
jgi:membrane-anchored mycosin MYCP